VIVLTGDVITAGFQEFGEDDRAETTSNLSENFLVANE
jgi:hypothetical protein